MNSRKYFSLLLAFFLTAVLMWGADKKKPAATPAPSKAVDAALLTVMEQELGRAMHDLAKTDPAPYFISYAATDRNSVQITASQGALFTSTSRHWRTADVTVRVATPALDNTHGDSRPTGMTSTP